MEVGYWIGLATAIFVVAIFSYSWETDCEMKYNVSDCEYRGMLYAPVYGDTK